MKYRVVMALTFAIGLFLSTGYSGAESDDDCSCDFSNKEYTAVCDCALVCGVAVKNGKNCNIVCDGSPTTVEDAYSKEMILIKDNMLSSGFAAFKNVSFAQYSLPKLVRSAYISASFIPSSRKESIDNLINKAFSEFGEEILKSYIEPGREPFKKEIRDGNWITVSYKRIKLNIPNYSIRFTFIK